MIAVFELIVAPIATNNYRPPHVYELDGVEYVNESLRNNTAMIILKEKFFDNIQKNLVNQIFRKIENSPFPD